MEKGVRGGDANNESKDKSRPQVENNHCDRHLLRQTKKVRWNKITGGQKRLLQKNNSRKQLKPEFKTLHKLTNF